MDQFINDDISNLILNFKISEEHFKDKKILITGGAGFLGSWLSETLIKLKSRVFCIDNLSTGIQENMVNLKENELFEFEKMDVIKEVPKKNYDFVIHMASRPSPEDYFLNQIETLRINSEGIKNVLEVAKKNNSVFLYTSTSEVYGDPQITPTRETYWGNVNPIGDRSCYDEGKRYGEALTTAYHHEFDINTKIARIFNTYGPRIRRDGTYGRALSRFVHRALHDEDIEIYGDGLQTRSFCYVSDMIGGIMMFLTQEKKYNVLNIGNDNEITINKLAEIIVEKINSKSKIIHKEKMPDDPRRRKPDLSKVRDELNWQPRITLDKGLDKTIEWFKKNNF